MNSKNRLNINVLGVVLMILLIGAVSFGALNAQDSTPEPTIEPTIETTVGPTVEVTLDPTLEQTLEPTLEPTLEETAEPTMEATTEDATMEPTMEATEETTTTTTVAIEDCDANLILMLYVAERFFDYGTFRDAAMETPVNVDDIDKGQYDPLFNMMMDSGMMADSALITVEIDDAARDRINEIMMMDVVEFETYTSDIMIANAAEMDSMTLLAPRNFVNEPLECSQLRDELVRFYTALVIVDADLHGDMMDMDSDMGAATSTPTGESSDTGATGDDELAEGAIQVNLSGANEVPGPGDEDGTGTAVVYLRTDTNQVCVDITVSEITLPAAAAHIHEGAEGEAGPPLIDLTAPAENGVSNTCVVVGAELMEEMVNNPQNYYVNVHTSDFPDGAVRGQMN